jgi:hypothetical protein
MFLLGFGAVAGITSGVLSLRHGYGHGCGCGGGWNRRAAFENRVADVCVQAAERIHAGKGDKSTAPIQ